MNRRTALSTLLGVGIAGTTGAASLLGAVPAAGRPVHRPVLSRSAPAQDFAIGVREYNWSRGSRRLFTKIFYPATGNPGGSPVPNAPLADGLFPVAHWNHGMYGNSDSYASQTHAIASAGFICPAPSISDNTNIGSVYGGEWSKDVSEVITQTLALNDASGSPFAGHIDTAAGVGVSGHSMGGMTVHGLLTNWPDDRIKAAVPVACVDMGNPAGLDANVLFIHGDQDPTCQYSLARQAYGELSAPKAFLTHVGADHAAYLNPGFPTFDQTQNTLVDWFRWSLYGDTAARDRLPEGATAPGTDWEAVLD
ncbi:alpha/beta hydrolase [Streptomyces phytophilus]|uniref:alpha/beta hydrolase n=1 Tax=Streptomyces phytophilus TaxID=722715 RepID=UPI00215D722A|nr:alpha/beta hydrolase [Streptomyces phytophilus]